MKPRPLLWDQRQGNAEPKDENADGDKGQNHELDGRVPDATARDCQMRDRQKRRNRDDDPQGINKVERSHRSDQQEFHQLLTYKDDVDLDAKLDEWEHVYNFSRPHGAFKGKTPYEALREKLQSAFLMSRGFIAITQLSGGATRTLLDGTIKGTANLAGKIQRPVQTRL